MELAIPPPVQLLASIFFGLIVAGTVAYKFFLDVRRPAASRSDYGMVGAALGDSHVLGEIAEQLRAIREIMTRQHDRHEDIVQALEEVAEAVRTRSRSRRPPAKRK